MMYCLLLLSLLILVAVFQVRWFYRRRRLAQSTWESLLSRVQPMNVAGLQAIYECYLQPDHEQLRIEPEEMWWIVGGLEGVANLKANAEAMLDLAMYAERWNADEGRVISEMIRRDAVRLNRAVLRIQLGFLFQFGFSRAPFYLQEAASSYFLIRSRLLGLYHNSHIALVPHLVEAI